MLAKNEIDLFTDILTSSFMENPSVNYVVKNDTKKQRRVRALSKYALRKGMRNNGIWKSSNQKGVAICYKYGKKDGVMDYLDQVQLVFKAITFPRILKVMKREKLIHQKRGVSEGFLYFWFLGVTPSFQDGEAARELRDSIFQYADEHHLPIYLETSVQKNRRVYERFGFTTYHSENFSSPDMTLYFMKRLPKPLN